MTGPVQVWFNVNMPVETFTKETFEASLPKDKNTEAALWIMEGLVDGEYVYSIHVSDYCAIKIRSSVRQNGLSGASGKDSIRMWLADPITGRPMGSKLSRWTTRVNGWQERIIKQLRELWRMAKKINVCPTCGKDVIKVFKVKKDGPNKGRIFLKCMAEPHCGYFEWLS